MSASTGRSLIAVLLAVLIGTGSTTTYAQEPEIRPSGKPTRPARRPKRQLGEVPSVPGGNIPPSASAPSPGSAAPAAAPAPAPAPSPAAAPAAAEPPSPAATGTAPPGEDDELYRCKKYPSGARIKVTLKPGTDFKDMVTWVMGFTCKNFIYNAQVAERAARVTIMAPTQMSPAEAYRLFLVALGTMNLTIVPKGKTLQIVEIQTAKEAPLPVYQGNKAPATDQVVRAIIRPEFLALEDATAVMNSLKTKDGVITSLPASGAIIVTDQGSSIDSMTRVLSQLDAPSGGERIYLIRVQHADAGELGPKLGEILGFSTSSGGGSGGRSAPGPGPGSTMPKGKVRGNTLSGAGDEGGGALVPSKVIVDARTNSLIVMASEKAYERILAIVRRLDVPVDGGAGGVHVYPLENANAEELANTIGQLVGQTSSTPAGGGGRRGGGAVPAGGPAGGVPGGGGPIAFEGSVRVTADKGTNALIVVSSLRDFVALREVIKTLDIPRRQVFVEATILEVSLDKTRRLGVAWHGGKDLNVDLPGVEGDAIVLGGVQHNELSSIQPSLVTGLGAALIGPFIPGSETLLGKSIPSLGVMFQALQNNSDVNTLSSPHLLTTDNEPAEITVGQNIPFQGGFTGLPGAGAAGASFSLPIASVQRQDVALKLRLTPHVNESDFVRLEIELEINDIASENFGGLGPSWTKRSVKNTVTVRDQQPVVLGGLMNDKVLISESKVPLLGDIPIMGYLFKFQSKKKIKTNLLILLTPYIVHDPSDIRRIQEKKVQERREFIETFTAFEDRPFVADIDFRKKRGLLEEINLAVKEAELADREYQDLIDAQLRQQEEGPIDVNQPGEKEPAKEPGQTAPPEPKKLEGAPGSSEEPPAGPSSAVPPAPAPVKEGVEG